MVKYFLGKKGITLKLFEPITIRGMTLKNRIIMPAMQLMLGLKNRRARAFYLERSRGGAGAIITCATSVDLFLEDEAWGRPDGARLFVEGMRSITEEIRSGGAKIGIQIWHGNQLPAGNGAPVVPGAQTVAPSAVDDRRALTGDEIKFIIVKFGSASAKAKEAGFDFVEVHGAHGYLPCQFFSGADNQRTDEYGGDLLRRMRFGLELVQSMRSQVGNNFPIFYRLGAEEKRPGGITIKESQAFAAELEKAGVDVFDVSIGLPTGRNASPSKRAKMGTFVNLAQAIKKSVSVPVMAVGRINLPEVAESILEEGKADLIGIARQLLADPYWPKKVQEGRADEIVACKSCNTCFIPMRSGTWKPGNPICAVNERAGREVDL
ncbi:MAG: NADH:flavin oxidoreductase [Deltaproteobacteria bacterium]|nr:NADH:flavin oxidoreductase [Deltaproteobacteria bacterium]